MNVELRSGSSVQVPIEIGRPTGGPDEIVVARLAGLCAVHAFSEDVELPLQPDSLDVDVERTQDGYAVTVSARTFTKDITFAPDRVAPDATVDEGMLTLLAGERHTFTVRTEAAGVEDALAGPPVLRTANDLRRVRSARYPTQ